MRLGVTMFATDRSMDVIDLAVEAEARGFESLWLPEHTHIPISRVTPPPTGEPELPEEYRRTLDPLIVLAAAANGWIPIGGAGLSSAIPQLRAAAVEAGRDPDQLEIIPFGSIPTAEKLEHFTSIGVTECVFRRPSAGRDVALPILDRQAKLLTDR